MGIRTNRLADCPEELCRKKEQDWKWVTCHNNKAVGKVMDSGDSEKIRQPASLPDRQIGRQTHSQADRQTGSQTKAMWRVNRLDRKNITHAHLKTGFAKFYLIYCRFNSKPF